MRYLLVLLTLTGLLAGGLYAQSGPIFLIDDGQVRFTSDAPLELIEARSERLRGVLDAGTRTFAFTIPVNSFAGFNSPLQREHFNENYLESDLFPAATFRGKIIEPVDFSQDGEYVIRAKGTLTIHGVARERIIRSTLSVRAGRGELRADFTVLLREHDISIPRIVYQKIAEEIRVGISADFRSRE